MAAAVKAGCRDEAASTLMEVAWLCAPSLAFAEQAAELRGCYQTLAARRPGYRQRSTRLPPTQGFDADAKSLSRLTDPDARLCFRRTHAKASSAELADMSRHGDRIDTTTSTNELGHQPRAIS